MWERCNNQSALKVWCPVLCHATCSVAPFVDQPMCTALCVLNDNSGGSSELCGMAVADAEKRRSGNWCVVWCAQCSAPQLVNKWCCPACLICCQEIYSQSDCSKHKQ
jgi:hypothetical protein